MNERKCNYRIFAFVDGGRTEIKCNPSYGCLKNFVWSGVGIKVAAAIALGRPNSENIEAYVEGNCANRTSSDSPER
jgi:hypothetical protein